jgi:hypothetical protein
MTHASSYSELALLMASLTPELPQSGLESTWRGYIGQAQERTATDRTDR